MTRPPSLYPQVAGPEALPAPDTIYGEGPMGPTPPPAPPVDPGVSLTKIRAAELRAIQESLGFPRAELPAPDTIYGTGPIAPEDEGEGPIDVGLSTAGVRAAELKNLQKLILGTKPTKKEPPVKKSEVSPGTTEKPKVSDDLEIPAFLKREKPKAGEVVEPIVEPVAEEKTIEQEMDSYRDKFNALIKEAEAGLDPKVIGLVRALPEVHP